MNKQEKQTLRKVINLLNLISSSDDQEIRNAVIESVVEILEEEITKA